MNKLEIRTVGKVKGIYKCDVCGELNENIDGFIMDKKHHPESIGCNCYGNKFTEIKNESQITPKYYK